MDISATSPRLGGTRHRSGGCPRQAPRARVRPTSVARPSCAVPLPRSEGRGWAGAQEAWPIRWRRGRPSPSAPWRHTARKADARALQWRHCVPYRSGCPQRAALSQATP